MPGYRCGSEGDAPAIVLAEVSGPRTATILVPAPEADILRCELHGSHTRLSHAYELVTNVLEGLRARVVAARLIIGGGHGLDGEIAVVRRWKRRRIASHAGDAVAVAIRAGIQRHTSDGSEIAPVSTNAAAAGLEPSEKCVAMTRAVRSSISSPDEMARSRGPSSPGSSPGARATRTLSEHLGRRWRSQSCAEATPLDPITFRQERPRVLWMRARGRSPYHRRSGGIAARRPGSGRGAP